MHVLYKGCQHCQDFFHYTKNVGTNFCLLTFIKLQVFTLLIIFNIFNIFTKYTIENRPTSLSCWVDVQH